MSRIVKALGLSRVQSEKGNTPDAISLTATAKAYTSEAKEPGALSSTSGAMYSRVPTMFLRPATVALDGWARLGSVASAVHRSLHPR